MMRPGHGILASVLALLLVGIVMVNSAGLQIPAKTPLTWESVLFGRTALLAALAVIALIIGSRFPIQKIFTRRGISNPIPWAVLGSVVLLLAVYVPGIGHAAKGSARWIDLGITRFQPSEAAKWSCILLLAWHGARRPGGMGKFFSGFAIPLGIVGILCAIIAIEDLGTAAIIGLVALLMLIAAGARWWHVALVIPVGIGGFVAALMQNQYRVDRILGFLRPYDDPEGLGYHMIQSMAAISRGGLEGRGLGNGLQKFGYLPEDTTDFIFAIICEELGIAGAIAVVAMYAVLLLSGWLVLRKASHVFMRLLCFGVLLTIGMQALLNLIVVTGLGPTTGIALPLISSGGTGWVFTAFCLGLLVAVDRHHEPHVATMRANDVDDDPELQTALTGVAMPT